MMFSSLKHLKNTRTKISTFSSSFLSIYSPILHQQTSNTHLIPSQSRTRTRTIFTDASDIRKEEIVIVGAGIAGLSTAALLHRFGVRSVVLEQAESLRTGGTSLTLSTNGWKVLDSIGIGDELRSQYLRIQGVDILTENGRKLRSIKMREDQNQEARPVERRTLLETLAKKLPLDSISFSSKLAKIEKQEDGETLLELVNGTRISSKVVIGCDGIHSPIAKWMGFPDPKYVGYCAIRGLGDYPNGQPYESHVKYIFGRAGLRAGYVPVSPTKVYWFVCFNSPAPGPKFTDPSVLKKQTKELMKKWPPEVLNIIDATPDDTMILTPLADRWLWPGLSPPGSLGGAVLVGDAWHPMTPNLGRGACCALEDAHVLVQKLVPALEAGAGPTVVEGALRSYRKERQLVNFTTTVVANVIGAILQSENQMVCAIRENVVATRK